MGRIRGRVKGRTGGYCPAGFQTREWRGLPSIYLPLWIYNARYLLSRSQSRKIETTLAALQHDNNVALPPLMNPAILEASDDLTNLSHLNEPAGMIRANWSNWLT